jgi:hypothetical protein
MSAERTAAEVACLYVIGRILRDPRIAYFMGPCTESYDLLTTAVAEIRAEPVEEYRASIKPHIRTVRMIEASDADA